MKTYITVIGYSEKKTFMVNQFRQHRTWRLAWLGVWKILERFRIAGKFKARFVDLLNLQISTLTK